MSPSEIKPATFRFVVRYLNKLLHRSPPPILLQFAVAVRGSYCCFLPLVVKHQATPLYFTDDSMRLPAGVKMSG